MQKDFQEFIDYMANGELESIYKDLDVAIDRSKYSEAEYSRLYSAMLTLQILNQYHCWTMRHD